MEKGNHDLSTLSSVLEKLRLQRKDNELVLDGENFTTSSGKKYTPEQLRIIKTYRFEGESDPSDAAILYLIEADDGLTGYSLDAYGVYTNHDEVYDDFIRRIPVEDRDEQLIFTLESSQ